jgi:hypothetical protein
MSDCPHYFGSRFKNDESEEPASAKRVYRTQPEREDGISQHGFVQLMFGSEKVHVVFFNGKKGEPIDMGGGKKEFWIDHDGHLQD